MNGPRRSVREELREVRARYILDVAQEVLLESGYRDAAMDEIAARVGIAKGTLYQHFPRKEDLILALFERHVARFVDVVQGAADAELPPRAKLEQILRYVHQDQHGAYAMLQLLTHNVELRRSLASHKGQALRCMERTWAQVERILDDGKSDGSFDPSLSPGLMMSAFTNALTIGWRQPRLVEEALSREQLAAQVCRVLFEGIGSP
jgi:AcrR family transcriptional regulator